MAIQPGSNRQLPDHAILDMHGKQAYLGNQYSCFTSLTVGVTTEVGIFLLQNPAVTTSAFPAQYTSLFCDLRSLTSLTGAQTAVMKVYLNPSATPGTPLTPVNSRPASPNTSVATVTLDP